MNNVVKCSLCTMLFDKTDPDYKARILRHNQWHNPKYKGSSRDSIYYNQKPAYKKRNTTMGVPKYE